MIFKYVLIFVLVIMLAAFVTFNMHLTNMYIFPFMRPVQINVITLLLIGFLLGTTVWFVIILRDQHNNKKSKKNNYK